MYFAGILILTENDSGYKFRYLPENPSLEMSKAVCSTLPLQEEVYKNLTFTPIQHIQQFIGTYVWNSTIVGHYFFLK